MADALGIVEEFYQALRTGDVERVVALLSSDHLEWTEAERFPYYGGVWRRAKDVVDHLFIPLSRDWEGFTVQPREFIANGEKVVSLGQYEGTYRATNRHLTVPFAHRWVVRDGKVVKFDQYTDTAKVIEATTQ